MVYVCHFWPPNFGSISVRYLIYMPKSLFLTPISFLSSIVGFLCLCTWRAHARYTNGRGQGRGAQIGGEFFFASVRAGLFQRAIYCDKLRPDVRYQSKSWSRRGQGSRSMWIINQYDLATEIAIHSLVHQHTCRMGSSIFAAMSRLNFAKNNQGLLPQHAININNKRRFFSVYHGSAYHAYPSSFYPNETGSYLLDKTCRCPHQHRQV